MSFGEKCWLQILELRDGVQPGLFITFSQDVVNISGSLKRCFASNNKHLQGGEGKERGVGGEGTYNIHLLLDICKLYSRLIA